MSIDIEKTIREYLPDVIHMSLGTCADGKPWVCEVHFSFDDDLNIYFRSRSNTRHSHEIAVNPNVAGNIVKQHGMEDKPLGVYFEGVAELLQVMDEENYAYKIVNARYGFGPRLIADANGEGAKFYKITVSDYYVFDVRTPGATGKYHLKWDK